MQKVELIALAWGLICMKMYNDDDKNVPKNLCKSS